jgi:hypothetical protein
MNIQKYFKLQELVCPDVYRKYGDRAWSFFDPRLLETLFFLREKIGRPFVVNNWKIGGKFSQRGLRCNLCDLNKKPTLNNKVYMSAHSQGQGVDFDVKGMQAHEVRKLIIDIQEELPYPIRLENNVSWVHMDVRDAGKKVYVFNP